MLLASCVDEFLVERAHLNVQTRERYEFELTRLMNYCQDRGVVEVESLTLPVMAGFFTYLRETPTTRGKLRIAGSMVSYHKRLMAFLHWAVEAEYVKPRVLKLPAPRREQAIPTTLNHDEASQLVKTAGRAEGPTLSARNQAIALLLVATGLRASELCRLTLEDVSLDGEGYVRVRHGKNDKSRMVGPLGSRCVRALKTYLRFRPTRQATAFFLTRTGGPLNRDSLYQALERLKHRAGVTSRCNPHSWRHTYARTQAEAGAPVIAISRLMGHSSIQTTSLYLGQFSSAEAMKLVKSPADSL